MKGGKAEVISMNETTSGKVVGGAGWRERRWSSHGQHGEQSVLIEHLFIVFTTFLLCFTSVLTEQLNSTDECIEHSISCISMLQPLQTLFYNTSFTPCIHIASSVLLLWMSPVRLRWKEYFLACFIHLRSDSTGRYHRLLLVGLRDGKPPDGSRRPIDGHSGLPCLLIWKLCNPVYRAYTTNGTN